MATHAHDHAGHGHHHHGPPPGTAASRLTVALVLIVAFMAVEVAIGIVANSMALIADAAHMLTDAAALALALVAARLAKRPPRGQLTFGLGRAEILSAQVNGATLLILGVFVVYGAIGRLTDPPEVDGGLVLAVALAGVVVNVAATAVLAGADRRSLNVEGAFQHLLTDLAAFLLTAVAAGVIIATGFHEADGIAAIVVALIMFRASYSLLRDSGRVFLEAAPEGLDVPTVGNAMAAVDGVVEVHDLHVWEVTSGFPALSAHVLVGTGDDCHSIRAAVERILHDDFRIEHTTLQVEHVDEPSLLTIERPR